MEKNATFYMANLGSELLRLFIWREKKDEHNAKASALRCLKIIKDLQQVSSKPGAIKEAHILEDIIKDFMENDLKNYSISKEDLEKYFNPFAMRVMSTKQ